MKTLRSVRLFFQEGASDKVYNADLVEVEEGRYSVLVEWGRRGSRLNRGSKAVKVALAAAESAYEKVVREKLGKGYEAVTDEVKPAAVAPPFGEGSGSKGGAARRARMAQSAQLLNTVDEDELARLIADTRHVAQQKLDGVRILVHVLPDGIVATNRSGEVTALDPAVCAALAALPAGSVVDGEHVRGEAYHLFDALQIGDEDLRRCGYLERYGWLEDLLLDEPLRLVATARTPAQKRALLERLRAEGAEGIVLKRGDAPYSPGRPASGGTQLKYKFIKSADVVITANAGNAYQMEVYDGGRASAVGKVFSGTTSESRHALDERLAAGETPVAEVRYLYATDDDQLYQPVFVQIRDDKPPEECTLAQLKRTSRRTVEAE
jgi:bifunctional non-homologous end joining protein LigD